MSAPKHVLEMYDDRGHYVAAIHIIGVEPVDYFTIALDVIRLYRIAKVKAFRPNGELEAVYVRSEQNVVTLTPQGYELFLARARVKQLEMLQMTEGDQ